MVRVLIIDDEPSYREYLSRYLRTVDYAVEAAAGHDDALEIAKRFTPDVVLADWMLQEQQHGLHIAEALRTTNSAIQIVLMTGFPTTEIREEAKRAGVRALLEKPFGLAELATAIAKACEPTSSS